MTPEEFAQVVLYLAAATGKPVLPEQARVYFDLLGDLPAAAVQAAARLALLESAYPTLPPVGTLRRLATQALAPPQESAYEAWGLVARAVRRYGYAQEARALLTLPPLARRAAECIGWRSLCDAAELETLRAQFRDAYAALAGRESRERLLPPALREQLALVGRAPPPALESKRQGAP